jgi:hypothetical protein
MKNVSTRFFEHFLSGPIQTSLRSIIETPAHNKVWRVFTRDVEQARKEQKFFASFFQKRSVFYAY